MGKRVKPAKAWAVTNDHGMIYHTAASGRFRIYCERENSEMDFPAGGKAVSVVVSPAPTPAERRISAAERRVVEAAVEWVKPPLWSGDATKAGLKLASAVDALQRAKGGANG